MNVKQNTDYAFRVLLFVAQKEGQKVSAKEISAFYDISYSHTVKVVNKLGKLGYLKLKRGRYGGGISLGMEPSMINIGAVVRQFETNLDIVDCFDLENSTCRIAGRCKLKALFDEAIDAFMGTLEGKTLADLGLEQRISSEDK